MGYVRPIIAPGFISSFDVVAKWLLRVLYRARVCLRAMEQHRVVVLVEAQCRQQ
jgi:hypothetical protein